MLFAFPMKVDRPGPGGVSPENERQLIVRPIGFVRSPFNEKVEAPRQSVLAKGVTATVELLPEYRDGLSDLEGFDRIWLLFWFDRAEGWRPKVLPPRSEEKRGVFATRSPHRPNPIGMSPVRLDRVEIDACKLHVSEIDLIDGTPILDIKPYIPYADAFPDASQGWLGAPEGVDQKAAWSVTLEPLAEEALRWIKEESGLDLGERIAASLALGPQPHAYRRIKELEDGKKLLAVKEWRVVFRHDDGRREITVEDILTGYRERDLAFGRDPVHDLHRRFCARKE